MGSPRRVDFLHQSIADLQLHGRAGAFRTAHETFFLKQTAHETSVDRLGFMGCRTVQDRPKTNRAAVRHYPTRGPTLARARRSADRSGQAGGAAPPSTVEAEPVTSGLAAVCRHAGHYPTLPYCASRALPAPAHPRVARRPGSSPPPPPETRK